MHCAPEVTPPGAGCPEASAGLVFILVQDALKQLEGLVHPLVYSERRQWLQQRVSKGRHSVLVLDIPLLYETDAEGMVKTFDVLCSPEMPHGSGLSGGPFKPLPPSSSTVNSSVIAQAKAVLSSAGPAWHILVGILD